MAGFFKKVFSFGKKEVEDRPAEDEPLAPINWAALGALSQQPAGQAAEPMPAPPQPERPIPPEPEQPSEPAQEPTAPSPAEVPEPTPAEVPQPEQPKPSQPERPVEPAQEPPAPAPAEIPQPVPAPVEIPQPAPQEVPPQPAPTPKPAPSKIPPPPETPAQPEPARPIPAPLEVPPPPAPAEPQPTTPSAFLPVGEKKQQDAPAPAALAPPPASLPNPPLRGGRAEGAGGGTDGAVPPTPSGPAGHLPLEGGEKPAPGKVTVARSVEQKAEPVRAPEPAPRKTWFQRMREGLARSSRELSGNIAGVFTKRKLDEETLQDLEDVLIRADLGVETALRITDSLASSRYGKNVSDDEVRTVMAQEISKVLTPVALPLELDLGHKPHVILVVGVNGTGKTTTIGKLAAKLTGGGLSVMLAAGDTFRAAAIEQLKIWGERTRSPVIASKIGADAAGLAYDAFVKAKEAGSDVLIIDTAGRLQNKTELMAELEKIVRVLGKLDPDAPHTVLQTVDATTGQNALNQVEIFRNIAGVNGLVMTKLDGTARGGILVAIAAKHKLPVYFIGVGEQVDDLEPFSASEFARAIAGVA